MHKMIVDNGLNQHLEGMLIEEIFVSDSFCVYLKETSDALACKMHRQKIHICCDHVSKADEMGVLCMICFKIENAIESKINSKVKLEKHSKLVCCGHHKTFFYINKCSTLI